MRIESFTNKDGECNENNQNALGLTSKTTTLHKDRNFKSISFTSQCCTDQEV